MVQQKNTEQDNVIACQTQNSTHGSVKSTDKIHPWFQQLGEVVVSPSSTDADQCGNTTLAGISGNKNPKGC